jgi:aryl-alcohol dehydrogenase-like predicted oxidoreductase
LARPTRQLGLTGMDITRVGFGAWAVGGGGWAFSWGPQDDEQSIAAIRHAVESGVNWVDTAPAYGLGHSEDVIARAMEGLPEADRPFIFTKCGLVRDQPYGEGKRTGLEKSLRAEVEGSLRRLRTERIDLFQVHWPADDAPIEEYWSTLLAFKDEGKIRAAGLCNHDAGLLQRAEDLGHVDSLQPPFSAIKRGAATEIAWCARQTTGVIVYSPMQAGLLTGAFSDQRVASLDPDDWRARDTEFQGDRLARNLALTDAFRPVAERHSTTLAAVAIAWVLSWPAVTGAIVGARSPAQVDGWLPAATLDLAAADLDELTTAIEAHRPDAGPSHPPVGSPRV